MHDEVHLTSSNQKRIYVHTKQVTFRQFLHADPYTVAYLLISSAFRSLETCYLLPQHVYGGNQKTTRATTAVQHPKGGQSLIGKH